MDINIKNLQTKVSIRRPRIKQVALRTLTHVGINEAALSVIFVTPQRMKALNTKHLKHAYVTDILTFDYGQDDHQRVADIIICPSVALANAKTFSLPLQHEIELYVIHGILHLAGYDDHTPRDIARMRKKEQEIVGILKRTP
jgi:probable rRNA maturation factor